MSLDMEFVCIQYRYPMTCVTNRERNNKTTEKICCAIARTCDIINNYGKRECKYVVILCDCVDQRGNVLVVLEIII